MIIYLVIIFQILAIVIFFERMMNGNIMILKDKYNLLTVELNELMKKSSF